MGLGLGYTFYPTIWVDKHNRGCVGSWPIKGHGEYPPIVCAPVEFSETSTAGRAFAAVQKVVVAKTPRGIGIAISAAVGMCYCCYSRSFKSPPPCAEPGTRSTNRPRVDRLPG